MLECKKEENSLSNNGFVRFRPAKSTTVTVPDHLRASMPDPLQAFQKKMTSSPATKGKSSEELQQDLDRINQEREQRMQALLAKRKERQMGTKSSSLSTVLPPPKITFDARKRQRKK